MSTVSYLAKRLKVKPSHIESIGIPHDALYEVMMQIWAKNPTFFDDSSQALRLLAQAHNPEYNVNDYLITHNEELKRIKHNTRMLEFQLYNPPIAVMIEDLMCTQCRVTTQHSTWDVRMRGADEPASNFQRCLVCGIQKRFG